MLFLHPISHSNLTKFFTSSLFLATTNSNSCFSWKEEVSLPPILKNHKFFGIVFIRKFVFIDFQIFYILKIYFITI